MAAGSMFLVFLAALARQSSTAHSSVQSGSDAAGALELITSIFSTGSSSLSLILPLGLTIALVIGVIAVTLGSYGGISR